MHRPLLQFVFASFHVLLFYDKPRLLLLLAPANINIFFITIFVLYFIRRKKCKSSSINNCITSFTLGIVFSRSLLKLFLFLFNFHQILFSEETKSPEDEKTLGHTVNAGVAIDLGGLDVDVNVGGVL